jgi:hypothetical protein
VATPAEVLRQYLIDVGVVGDQDAAAWRSVVGPVPDQSDAPADYVSVQDTPALAFRPDMRTGDRSTHPAAQIAIRSGRYPDGWAKGEEIQVALDAVGADPALGGAGEVPVEVGSEVFLLRKVTVASPLGKIGQEENGRRQVFALNVRMWMEADTVAAPARYPTQNLAAEDYLLGYDTSTGRLTKFPVSSSAAAILPPAADGYLKNTAGVLSWAGLAGDGSAITNLDASQLTAGTVPAARLPSIAITDVFAVASQAAMLALTAQRGDVAVRSDLNKSFVLATESPGTLADWKELLTPTDAVQSVNGKVGAVVLTTTDVAEGAGLYFTNSRARGVLAAGAGISYDVATGTISVNQAFTPTWTGQHVWSNLLGRIVTDVGQTNQAVLYYTHNGTTAWALLNVQGRAALYLRDAGGTFYRTILTSYESGGPGASGCFFNSAGVVGWSDSASRADSGTFTGLNRVGVGQVGVFHNGLTTLGGLVCGQPATGTVGLTVKAIAAATANLTEWQNSSGTPVATLNANSQFALGPSVTTPNIWLRGEVAQSGVLLNVNGKVTWTSTTNAGIAADTGIIRSAASVVQVTNGSSGFGALTLGQPAVGTSGLTVQRMALGTAPLVRCLDSDGATKLAWVHTSGAFVTKGNAAPADADLGANELTFWFDSTNGAAKVNFKGKTANGTVVTAQLAAA